MENIKVHVCVVVFDILFFDGKSVLNIPLKERQKLLKENFSEIENKFIFAKFASIEKYSDETILTAIDNAVNNQCEGLMVKDLNSPYEINKRSSYWVKVIILEIIIILVKKRLR